MNYEHVIRLRRGFLLIVALYVFIGVPIVLACYSDWLPAGLLAGVGAVFLLATWPKRTP